MDKELLLNKIKFRIKNLNGLKWGRNLVLNDTMSAVSKFNKCETCQQKITNSLTNKKHVLIGSYFRIHVSCILDFDI